MPGLDIFELSVCVCTRNRPKELVRAIESLSTCRGYIHQIIVSDDSTNNESRDMLKNVILPVYYVTGPKRGLSANRNNALQYVTGSHVLFIDDDVVVESEFIPNIIRHYVGIILQRRPHVIVTGLENKEGKLVFPHEQNFLGFQKKEYDNLRKIRTIVINSTVFPVTVFSKVKFDERLMYGYEEVDIATRASYAAEFDIELCPTAINNHFPSEINRDFYRPYINASRMYVTFKRYFYSERRPFKAFLFAVVAINHLIGVSLMHQGFLGLASAARTVRLAVTYILSASESTLWTEHLR